MQAFTPVTVSVYVIVASGRHIGSGTEGSLNPKAGVQIGAPLPEPCNCTLSPEQTVKSGPASTVGCGRTMMATASVAMHWSALVTVTV